MAAIKYTFVFRVSCAGKGSKILLPEKEKPRFFSSSATATGLLKDRVPKKSTFASNIAFLVIIIGEIFFQLPIFSIAIFFFYYGVTKIQFLSFLPHSLFSGCSGCCSLHRRSKFRNGIVWSCWRHIFQWYLGKGESSDFLQGLCSFSAALIVMYLPP